MRIFLAGGTGLVGSRLVKSLVQRGDTIVVLSRDAAKAKAKLTPDDVFKRDRLQYVQGDPTQPGPWMDDVAGCDAVVNLVGEGIFAERWDADFKQILRDSRIRSTQNIVEAMTRAGGVSPPIKRPSVLVNASAIGYYGPRGDEDVDETSADGGDFLARLCVDWEAAAKKVEPAGVRLVLLRTGIVLDPLGGPLQKMSLPIKLFVGGKVGSGKQWVSWIHHDDEIGLILWALDDPNCSGPLNSVAPQPVTNLELTRALGAALHRPTLFPAPAFMLRLTLGEVADVVTTGQKVLPKKAQQLGFRFRYPEINAALGEIYAR